jgi:RND family efflux transporter MFP subunit
MTEERHSELAIHHLHPADGEALVKRKQVMRRTSMLVLVGMVLLALGAGRTLISRSANAKGLEAAVGERAVVYVKTAFPKTGASQTLALPGTLQGFVQAPIAARASGYVKRWTKDIGTRVQKGELLAEIETPELDQQLSQGAAARAQAASSLGLAASTKDRWEALRQKDAVSQQEVDERRSNEVQARANLAAAEANVDRLRQLAGFKRVVAPFAGVIIRRNVDVGDLIDAGGARPLFVLAQTDSLRIYVNVPQAYAHLVKVGQKVDVTQAELRGQVFKGEVARSSGAIDTATRTLQVEVTLPNKDGVLLPGAYVQVALPLSASQSLTIPANALLIRGTGMQVAVVDGGGAVRLKQVKIGRNYGEAVELLDGVGPKDQLVLNPSDSIAEGDKVKVAVDAPAKGGPAPKGAAPAKEKS